MRVFSQMVVLQRPARCIVSEWSDGNGDGAPVRVLHWQSVGEVRGKRASDPLRMRDDTLHTSVAAYMLELLSPLRVRARRSALIGDAALEAGPGARGAQRRF